MDAVGILKKDHRELKQFFKEFEEAGERAHQKKQEIAEKAIKEIKTHSQLEEQIFYPAAQRKGNKEIQELVREGIEEHRVADYLIERIQATPVEDPKFDARFKVLSESVKHHINEEDRILFPESKKFLASDLDRLGAEMEALEKQLEG